MDVMTIRPLKTGDEITVDYSLYLEPHQYNTTTYTHVDVGCAVR